MTFAKAEESFFDTGHILLDCCRCFIKQADGLETTEEEGLKAMLLVAYIEGFEGGLRMSEAVSKEKLVNLPNQPTHEQYARVIHAYLVKHPEELHNTARVLVFLSLKEGFINN